MRTFTDRADAGRALAASPEVSTLGPDTLILGLPRGGVIVAAEVARALDTGLDALVVRKLGAPGNPEYAIGAVDADGVTVGDPLRQASPAFVQRAVADERAEIVRRERVYRAGREGVAVTGRHVLLVDDGIATGLPTLAAVGWLQRHGAAEVTVLAPVAAPGAVRALESAGATVVALETPWDFAAVGQAYRHFDQNTDAEVVEALRAARTRDGQRSPDTSE